MAAKLSRVRDACLACRAHPRRKTKGDTRQTSESVRAHGLTKLVTGDVHWTLLLAQESLLLDLLFDGHSPQGVRVT